MTDSPDLLNALFDSRAWPSLRVLLHIGFFVGAFYILRAMLLPMAARWRAADGAGSGGPWARYLVPVLLALPFLAVLVYQATWQLGGMLRPDFVAFMQSHDPRQFNPAHWIARGRILDHRGAVLAYSREDQGRVSRVYPEGAAFSHVVGYSNPRFGATGIEAAASVYLNGGAPEGLRQWSELGRQVLTQSRRPKGQDLVLTLDTELQRAAVDLLGADRGAVVVLRPRDGAIRVLATTPAFDPNAVGAEMFRGNGFGSPLLNRATQGLYPPGSTFKIVLAAQALNAGFKGTLDCPADGFTTSARYRKIRDHDYYSAKRAGRVWGGFGQIGLATAFARSSNVFFAKLGASYGHEPFYQNLEQFWFNRRIALYQSPFGSWAMRTGQVPRLSDSDQYGLAQMSIGQGKMLVTPAHMALIAAAVANEGVVMRPRLVVTDRPEPLARFMPEATAASLTKLMRKVVTEGTARGIEDKALPIAGKTGTAQSRGGEAHSWFVGFAPADRPALAFAVMVEEGGNGSTRAAPIARDLMQRANALGLLP
ncbi:MAG TPA: penicillin-binding protein 2 [Chromatiaceae bacterium]|nr:penicillin-binding protein 2 [Chromatiaceae bacterium]